MYKLKDNSGRLTILKLVKNSYEFLITAIISQLTKRKFIFRLKKNHTFNSWSSSGIFVAKQEISRDNYHKIAGKLQNFIEEEQFYGVWCNNNCPINLNVIRKSTRNLKLTEGPILLTIDQ